MHVMVMNMGTARDLNGRLIGIKPNGQPYRVLVVDDEKITRNLVARILKSVGFDIVAEGTNGVEAIELYREYKPDIVTLDVVMPKMDGVSALQHIMKRDSKAKVVMLTLKADKETVDRLVTAGAADYFVKPLIRKPVMGKLVKLIQTM